LVFGSKLKTKAQLGLFDDAVIHQAKLRGVGNWPDRERFPYNLEKNKVEDLVLKDLASSISPLIITGFTSLDYIINFVADLPADQPEVIRLLVGSEPVPARRPEYSLKKKNLPQEIIDYWLNEGISLRLCYKIVLALEMVKAGRVRSQYVADDKHKLHGKIYVGDDAVTLGIECQIPETERTKAIS
jgi:hypothetical protein